jgi:hypothetical protein
MYKDELQQKKHGSYYGKFLLTRIPEMWRLTCQSCDQMEGPLLFKLGLRCNFNGRVNGRNIVNEPNRALALCSEHQWVSELVTHGPRTPKHENRGRNKHEHKHFNYSIWHLQHVAWLELHLPPVLQNATKLILSKNAGSMTPGTRTITRSL